MSQVIDSGVGADDGMRGRGSLGLEPDVVVDVRDGDVRDGDVRDGDSGPSGAGTSGARPPAGQRPQWTNLALIALALAVPVLFFDAGLVVLVIGALLLTIMIHEAGHFFVAKATGMKATEFFLGFGPRLFSFRRGETEYGMKAFPLGGYVKVIGMASNEEVDPTEEHRTYRSKATWQRVAMAAAGPATHFVVAFILLAVAYGPVGERGPSTRLTEVIAGSPAAAGGLRDGDRIVEMNGVRIDRYEEIPPVIRASEDQVVDVTVERDGVRLVVAVRPTRDTDGIVRMGILPGAENHPRSLVDGMGRSVQEVATITDATVDGLVAFFRPDRIADYANTVATANRVEGSLTSQQNDQRVSSPVSMVRWGTQFYEQGIFWFLWFMAVFNLGVGVFNLVPLPPFDGGHIVIAFYEKAMSIVKRRRHYVDMQKVMPVAATVMVVLFVIFISALYLDILKPM